MTDIEVGDRLLEMREATARRCIEIIMQFSSWGETNDEIAAIKKEFGLEE